jgi:hypothetical protein
MTVHSSETAEEVLNLFRYDDNYLLDKISKLFKPNVPLFPLTLTCNCTQTLTNEGRNYPRGFDRRTIVPVGMIGCNGIAPDGTTMWGRRK